MNKLSLSQGHCFRFIFSIFVIFVGFLYENLILGFQIDSYFGIFSRSTCLSARKTENIDATQVVNGIDDIIDRYDGFILDQFGVLHNGAIALPGAIKCIDRLHSKGKKLVILSNSSKNAVYTLRRLPSFGFNKSMFIGAITSGDEALKYINCNKLSDKKCLLFAWKEWQKIDKDFFNALQLRFCGAEEADFLLAHGTDLIVDGKDSSLSTTLKTTGQLDAYLPYLETALARGLPLVVANPDFLVNFPDGTQGYMPGNISKKYLEMGGTVFEFGKPHKAHFEACIELLQLDKEKIVHVGDSLHHDVQGATDAGIDSILIGAGIHAPELQLDAFDESKLTLDEQLLQQLYDKTNIKPTWASSLFCL